LKRFGFFEFFAGGGMARLGLGDGWECLFANEWCEKKGASYRANFPPAGELRIDDIWNLTTAALPGKATLAWASFPCQDLSLAGNGAGLNGSRSGALIQFWRLMQELKNEGRSVPIVVLENVVGALTSNGGGDFQAIVKLARDAGYRIGGLVIDASLFVPQSRPRLFLIAVDGAVPEGRISEVWHPPQMRAAAAEIPDWIWWNLPAPPPRTESLASYIEADAEWHPHEKTERILAMMSPLHLRKVKHAQRSGSGVVGTVYKRMRVENGVRIQRAEARFDGVSGCLRTPAGGSSRQTVIEVNGPVVRTRLMTPREAACLMGLPKTYQLPERPNDAYHLTGDGVAVPVVAWLERYLLRPLAVTLSWDARHPSASIPPRGRAAQSVGH
jgi:DNA (cytosine-5)-methyltransferase 1